MRVAAIIDFLLLIPSDNFVVRVVAIAILFLMEPRFPQSRALSQITRSQYCDTIIKRLQEKKND